MEKINVNKITDRQKLKIKNGLNTYLYIQNHLNIDDEDFRDVYYDFYLKARSSVFAKMKKNPNTNKKENNKNWSLYFELLKNSDGKEDLIEIVRKLKENLDSQSFEFSFSTKLLHTKNNEIPIFDSKVRKYLKGAYKIKFQSGSFTDYKKIEADWLALNNWYNNFLDTEDAKNWLSWFDNIFPEGRDISDIKKIDFIIFACVD